MGREVRLVPPNWQHPKDEKGRYIPLLKTSFEEALAEWLKELKKSTPALLREKWAQGFRRGYGSEPWVPIDPNHKNLSAEAYYEGELRGPDPWCHMPQFPKGEATHLMMYEDTSEGTPISPAFDTPEKLARWLADNNASAFGGMGASYEDWLGMIGRGYSISAVIGKDGLQSGVAAGF